MQNPPKRWGIFTSKKKGCEGVYEFSRIFLWSCQKNYGRNGGGGGGGVEVPVERMRVKSVLPKMKKKKKKEKRSEGVSWPKEWKDRVIVR